MSKLRHRILPAKSLIKQYMKRCTWQPLFTTNNMGYLHQMIVDDICEVISRQLVCTLIEHLIIEDVSLHANLTTDKIVDKNLLASIDLKADNILLTIGNELFYLFLWKCQRVTHLTAGVTVVLKILYLSTLCLQLLRSIESDICLVCIQQLLNIFLIDITTLDLTIRTLVATKAYTLIKLNAEPFERLNDIFLCTWYETVTVSILYTENEVTAMLFGKEIIIQSGTYTTDMQSARRTWCKTHPYSSF